MSTQENNQIMQPPLVKQIAEIVLNVDTLRIPADVLLKTKTLILDTIGCALAARREAVFERALKAFAAIGGAPQCSVIGTQQRAPVTSAVMLNGILIRALDMNDAYVGHGHLGHPSDNIAVALSVGEQQRSPGLDVIASVAVGYEIYCRIQDLVQTGGAWDHVTGSALAAPAIAARLMKLSPDQLAHALALSAAHGNTLAEVRSGQLSNAKAMANGFVAMQATLCALLAAEGVTGPMTVLEGRRGLNRGLLAGGDLNLLAEPIRERFRISDVGIKPYPCIGTAQTMIAAVLQLRAGIADPVNEVKRIAVRMADVPLVSGQVEDQDRRFPTSRETADHSFYFLVAVALADGELTQRQFDNERWLQPAMKSLMERLTIRTDAALNQYTPGSYPAVVEMTLENGERRAAEVIFPKGHPQNPMSRAEVEAKFRSCARAALSEDRQARIISLVYDLDRLTDVSGLLKELTVGES